MDEQKESRLSDLDFEVEASMALERARPMPKGSARAEALKKSRRAAEFSHLMGHRIQSTQSACKDID
jgi:hypothetical protein